MGDPAQLPPIGEASSKVWQIQNVAYLYKIMRYDNAILELATRLREQVDSDEPRIALLDNHSEDEGIWKLSKLGFEATIRDHAQKGLFSVPDMSKVIAWRNVRVQAFNTMIRGIIFPGVTEQYVIDDRVLFASHAKEYDVVIATIDTEGVIVDTETEIQGFFKVWKLQILLDDGEVILITTLHEDSRAKYEELLRILAEEARARERKWTDYWNLKEQFPELKYAYAITAHRSQGSTYKTAFVCWQDILRNSDVNEAYRCLYVACTRPSKQLILS
jgi:exodeoxyribonuclease-5